MFTLKVCDDDKTTTTSYLLSPSHLKEEGTGGLDLDLAMTRPGGEGEGGGDLDRPPPPAQEALVGEACLLDQ